LLALGRSLRERFRAARRIGQSVALGVVVALAGGAPARAQESIPPESTPPPADHLSRYTIDDANPKGHLPTPQQISRDPVQFGYYLMDLASRADEAEKRGDQRAVIRYFEALATLVPQRSISYGRICKAYEALHERDNALKACRDAMGREGVRVDDFSRYVRILLEHPGAITAGEREDIQAIADHLRGAPETRLGASDIECQLAVRTSDRARLERCVGDLVAAVPKEPRTLSYQWALALERRDDVEAARLVQRAKRAGLGPDAVAKMMDVMQARRTRRNLPLWGGAVLILAGLAVLVLRRGSGTAARRAPV
jgi:hypothetical protein